LLTLHTYKKGFVSSCRPLCRPITPTICGGCLAFGSIVYLAGS